LIRKVVRAGLLSVFADLDIFTQRKAEADRFKKGRKSRPQVVQPPLEHHVQEIIRAPAMSIPKGKAKTAAERI